MNIELNHKTLRIEIDPITGQIAALGFGGDNLMLRGARSGFSLTINGATISDWSLLGHSTAKIDNGIEAALEYRSEEIDGIRVWQILDLYGDAGRVDRWIHVAGKRGERQKLDACSLSLSGLTAGDPDNTTISLSDDLTDRLSLGDIAKLSDIDGLSETLSPVESFGTVIFQRKSPSLTLAVTPMPEEFSASTAHNGIDGKPQHTLLTSRFAVNAWLGGDDTLTAGEQLIQVRQEPVATALKATARLLANRSIVPPDARPEWLRSANIVAITGLNDTRQPPNADSIKAQIVAQHEQGNRVAVKIPIIDAAQRDTAIANAKLAIGDWSADAILVTVEREASPVWDETESAPQPYEAWYAAFALLDEIREAIREINPNAALIGLTAGPEMVRRCDAVVGGGPMAEALGGWSVRV